MEFQRFALHACPKHKAVGQQVENIVSFPVDFVVGKLEVGFAVVAHQISSNDSVLTGAVLDFAIGGSGDNIVVVGAHIIYIGIDSGDILCDYLTRRIDFNIHIALGGDDISQNQQRIGYMLMDCAGFIRGVLKHMLQLAVDVAESFHLDKGGTLRLTAKTG